MQMQPIPSSENSLGVLLIRLNKSFPLCLKYTQCIKYFVYYLHFHGHSNKQGLIMMKGHTNHIWQRSIHSQRNPK